MAETTTGPAALVCEERHYSSSQLDGLTGGLAAALAKRGVTAGARVALMSSNRPEFVAALRAIWRLGATVVLLSPAWRRDEAEHALALTTPTHAVGDHPVLAELMPMLHLDDPIEPHDVPSGRPDADAVLVFSSGTTGLPKAVRHTHASLQAAVRHWRNALRLTARDRIQIATPPAHILGLLNILTALDTGLWSGCTGGSISMRCCSTSKPTASPSKWPWRQ
ncbi:AMP-binding enzyme family protein [Mycobacterium xenopi 3993]|nr:AMP-binding enzyme family protein [Mycobacterium xenopi 3993]